MAVHLNPIGSNSTIQSKPGGDAISANSYREAGVDIAAAEALVDRIKPEAERTKRLGAIGGLGGFGALFDVKASGFADPLLVSATDGVGTKLMIAIALDDCRTIGIDLVAMCVNDLVVQGATPLFFLDYFATGKLDPERAHQVIAGVADGCLEAGCALIGGETAEMPGLYDEGDFDLAGFAVGAVERSALIDGSSVSVGDAVLGLRSSGVHSNGYSLVRKIVSKVGLSYADPAPFSGESTLGEALLTPTRLYVRQAMTAIATGGVGAMAHITGGGLHENLPRILPVGAAVRLDAAAWTPPPVFHWLAQAGGIPPRDMLTAFNCGIGYVLIVEPDRADAVETALRKAGEETVRIGEVVDRGADAPAVMAENLSEGWLR